MTNKENSIKLKELGFGGEYTKIHGMFGGLMDDRDTIKEKYRLPTYGAEVLFEWLREWLDKTNAWLAYDINCFSLHNDTGGNGATRTLIQIEFKTNLADMLAESIIWILENES